MRNQEKLAILLGVSRAKVAKWETDVSEPKRFELEPLATKIGVPVDWFYDGGDADLPIAPEDIAGTDASKVASGFATSIAIRAFRGAMAALNSAQDEEFVPDSTFVEIPTAFIVGGTKNAERHAVVTVSGNSLAPRIWPGERVLFYNDDVLYKDSIVLAQSPDNRCFVKILRANRNVFELESINPQGAHIKDMTDWIIKGHAQAILGAHNGDRNIEWDFGSPLKARP